MSIFVVSGNGQALMGLLDTDAFKLINVKIYSIDAEVKKGGVPYKHESCPGVLHRARKRRKVEVIYNTDNISKFGSNRKKSMVKTNPDKPTNYFIAGPSCESDKRKNAKSTQRIHKEFEDVFNGIWCFEGTFSLQLKPNRKPYQVLPWHFAYALQKPFQEELLRLQKQDMITPLGVDEVSEWCNSFVVVPKDNGKVRLCSDPAQLN